MICGDINKLYDECLNNLSETLTYYRKDLNSEKAKEILNEFRNQGKILVEKWN